MRRSGVHGEAIRGRDRMTSPNLGPEALDAQKWAQLRAMGWMCRGYLTPAEGKAIAWWRLKQINDNERKRT